jgi:hypothetical protein
MGKAEEEEGYRTPEENLRFRGKGKGERDCSGPRKQVQRSAFARHGGKPMYERE